MKAFVVSILLCSTCTLQAANLAYIHGRVADDGSILDEGEGDAFDPMLLSDTGRKGMSQFQELVEGEGHNISSHRDKDTALTASFLQNFDAVVFGLHQKIWSASEKTALDDWLNAGGGMLVYSDSASGGSFRIVGAQNPIGQNVTNNLIAQYGLQVTVDQADGVPIEEASDSASIESLRGLKLKGEGVSPVAIASDDSSVEILIPYTAKQVSKRQGLTINNPVFAALALKPVGAGHVSVLFDRQPMWNNGPGADINDEDNRQILRELVNFLAEPAGIVAPPNPPSPPSPPPTPSDSAILTPIYPLLLDE